MALFRRSKSAAITATYDPIGAELAVSGGSPTLIYGSTTRWRAMRIPTVSRARDLLCSAVASMPIRQYSITWDPATGDEVETELQPEPWMYRPDPRTTKTHLLAWTVDDLIFYSRAYWLVTARYSTGFPSQFLRLPAEDVTMEADLWANNIPVGEYQITYQGAVIPNRDVVVFYSPIMSLLDTGSRTVTIAERLDMAAAKFASTPAAFGWLKQTGGEDLTADELQTLANGWESVRDTSAVAALNQYVDWVESKMDPSRLQMLESRQFAALEISRIANIPPYLVGVDAAGFTYANAQQARQDLYLFGALPYALCIAETLSGETVTSRGRVVRLDAGRWLHELTNERTPDDGTSDPDPLG